jgi:short-subunit dehydrogenase
MIAKSLIRNGKTINIYVIITGLIVGVASGLQWLSQYGNKILSGEARKLDKDKDVILITGGSLGLGRKISAAYAIEGFQVVNLDIVPPDVQLPNIHYFKCDISSLKDVQAAQKQIIEKVGKVTVLINNAAIVGAGSILDVTEKTVESVLNVNLVSQFWTIKTFLPDMIELKRGHIVTVSSVIGYFGPAKCSLYSASKAGLLTLHDSLTHELIGTGVKTLLVTPGQLNSQLFGGVQTPSKFLAPILSTAELALKITTTINEGKCGQLFAPTYTSLIPFANAVLPSVFMEWLRKVYKVDQAMDGYSKGNEPTTESSKSSKISKKANNSKDE